MQYPFRIKIIFAKADKLRTIQMINRFLNENARGAYMKWNIIKQYEFVGIEVGFASHTDAVFFKLGHESDGEEISSDSFLSTERS